MDATHETRDDQILQVEATALRLLGYRDHSSGELRDKLHDRDYADDHIDEVIATLEEQGWLDDRQFAEHQTEILVRKGWGPHRIRQKLEKHGVPRELSQQAVDDAADIDTWLQGCRERLLSKFSEPDELDRDEKQKAFRHLKHRGFSPSTIRRVLFDGAGQR